MPQSEQKRERSRARELRLSAWWKGQTGRGTCHHCQQRFHPSELTMDHKIPIARGGKSNKSNCVPACKACNTHKGHRLGIELEMDKLAGTVSSTSAESCNEDGNDIK